MLLTAPASLGTMYLGIVCEHELEYECTVAVASTITSTSTITITSTDRQQQQYHLNHRSEQVILRPLTLYRTITAGLREFLVCFRFSSVRESYPASTGVAHQTTYDFQKADTWRFFYMFLLLFFFKCVNQKIMVKRLALLMRIQRIELMGPLHFFSNLSPIFKIKSEMCTAIRHEMKYQNEKHNKKKLITRKKWLLLHSIVFGRFFM